MYTIDFSGTGTMTLNNFTQDQQKQILYVLDKVVSKYDAKAPDATKVRDLGDGFYVIKINYTIRVMAKIQDNVFNIIDVFNHARSEKLATA
jgi:phage-related protein